MMAALKTATLDANDETFVLDIDAASRAMVTMTISGTITVTWTVKAAGGSNAIALRKADDSTAAAYTASDYLLIEGPCTAIATASSVSSGSCAIEARAGREA